MTEREFHSSSVIQPLWTRFYQFSLSTNGRRHKMIEGSYKKKIGNELMSLINKNASIAQISRWADLVYSNNCRILDSETDGLITKISFMQIDSQFELTVDELRAIANKLISEGDEEELGKPISEIKDIAEELGGNWLMCPLCQESWEDNSKYGMVCCPKCNQKLHNPKFKTL